MTLHNISFDVKNTPVLDDTFVPLYKFNKAFLAGATKPVKIAVERNNGYVYVYDTFVREGAEFADANKYYVERMVKAILWCVGGYKVTIAGDKALADYIAEVYSPTGARAFDFSMMSRVYENEFTVEYAEYDNAPKASESSKPIGRNLDGCRIGFDAGGSDRKVSAVIDGESVFSEEVVWFPKVTEDPAYHYNEIVTAFKTAASKMPRVDAIGISSAGIYIDNRTMLASLFLKVPQEDFDKHVKDIYIRAAKEIGDIPVEVANDGDVTALAGAMSLEDTNILGIAMGTSEAGGYVDGDGNVKGWLNELAFMPCDGQPQGAWDEWSGDIGCGVKYFSQDAVIKLAPKLNIELEESLSPGEKLAIVQGMRDDKGYTHGVEKIYETIGMYLGHTLAYYSTFYDIKHVLLMGRVVSGEGGDIVLDVAKKVLADEYPELSINLQLPDEKSRRVGQSVAAASLPKTK
ncbi:MAG: ROK family protein [Defluviitaleaceae bacterium]|nr:ROK family protein [Defluviitaleaceae bacterium]